jgi:hypothetical protein
MLCVAAMKTPESRTSEDIAPYLNMFHAGFLIASEERDCAEILELAGMPSIRVETVERGIFALFISGSLSQWKDAVLRGCQSNARRETRHVYNQIYTKFKDMGLAGIFSVKSKQHPRDNTFLLEYRQ